MTRLDTQPTAAEQTGAASGPLRRWAAATFGGLPRIFWIIFAGSSIARLGFFVVPFLSFYLTASRRLAPAQITVVMTCFGAGWTAGGPFGGWLADRFGRRVPLVTGSAGAAAAYLLLATTHHVTGIAVCALGAGLTFDLYRPAVAAVIADRVPAARQGQAFQLWYVGVFNGAGALGTILGGVFANHGFWILFVADAAMNVGFAAAMLRLVPASPPPAASGGARIGAALTDPRLLGFTLISLLILVVYAQSIVTLPVAFARAGITPLGYGLISTANPAAVVILMPLLQPWLARRSQARMCAAAAAVIGVGIALTGSGHTIGWYAATTVMWTLGEAVFMTFAPAIVTALAPPHLMASYAGVWQTAMGGAMLLGPLCGGALLTLAGPGLLWTACAVGGAAAGFGCLAISPVLARAAAEASS